MCWSVTKIQLVRGENVCKRRKKLTSFYPFGIQFQHRRILHQHHHHLAFSWIQSFLAGATATYYLLAESDAIWCEHISCKFNFYSRKRVQACLMPPHKPGKAHSKKVMTEERENIVHRWKCQITIHTHHRNIKQSDTSAQYFWGNALRSNDLEEDIIRLYIISYVWTIYHLLNNEIDCEWTLFYRLIPEYL